jgi:hypothetical protein
MKCLSVGNAAPGKKLALIVGALSRGAKEIDSPLHSGMCLACVHRRQRYAQFGSPDVPLGVDTPEDLEKARRMLAG